MKRMRQIITAALFFVIIIGMNACEDKNEPIGLWDDIIKLSTDSAEFKSGKDSVTISTEGDWWWVIEIRVDGESYYNFEEVDLESDNYAIERAGIFVERRDKNTLFIRADANTTGGEREIVVGLEAGDYFDQVRITQKAN